MATRYISFAPMFSAKVFVTILLALPTPIAKDISVGGTSIFSKLPLILSLPPIAPTPKPICAYNAPSNAERGCPHLSLS